MTPKLVFWTYALFHMTAMAACATMGWRAIRRGDVDRHRRWMNAVVGLVVFFVVAYALKLVFLGREDLSLWSRADLTILRIHETFILVMLLAGGTARWIARRIDPQSLPAAERPGDRPRHRKLGKTALVFGLLAFLTAMMVLWGMVNRAGTSPATTPAVAAGTP